MKKYILIVEYGTGKMAINIDTPDIQQGIEKFKSIMACMYGADKNNLMPDILKAEIVPLLYESEFTK